MLPPIVLFPNCKPSVLPVSRYPSLVRVDAPEVDLKLKVFIQEMIGELASCSVTGRNNGMQASVQAADTSMPEKMYKVVPEYVKSWLVYPRASSQRAIRAIAMVQILRENRPLVKRCQTRHKVNGSKLTAHQYRT